jgi:hypothetical protein
MTGCEYDHYLICEKKQDPQHNTTLSKKQSTMSSEKKTEEKIREENKQEMKVRIGFLHRITYL